MTTPASNFIRVPLDKLELCPDQVRQHKANGIEALAASIATSGLLQNLVVSTDGDGTYQVHAGSRRLRALQLLRDRNALAADHDVPCQLIDRGNAIAAGLAENTLREAMHPADEFDAFRVLVDKGEPVDDVAAAFGVTRSYVNQRMRLAKASPRLVAEYRAGAMSLEQLQTFTLTEDHARQEAIWFDDKRSWKPSAWDIRRTLTEQTVELNDKRVKLVGYKAYADAGGTVTTDLFKDDVYLADVALLDRLVAEKLQAQADALRAEGWGFVDVVPEMDYATRDSYRAVPVPRREPTPEELARMEALEAERAALQEKSNRLQEGEDDYTPEEDEQARAIDDRLDAIETELSEMDDARAEVPANIRQQAGVVLGLSYNGLEVLRGVLKPGQKIARDGSIGSPPADKPKAKKPDFSDAYVRRLSAHRTAALQRLLAFDDKAALAVLVHQLLDPQGHGDRLQITPQDPRIEQLGPDVNDCRALRELRELGARVKQPIPSRGGLVLNWLLSRSVADLIDLLAYLVARTYTAVHGADGKPSADSVRLAEALELDMADWWQPTAESFLDSVPAAVIIEAVREACGKDIAATLTGLKKKDLVAKAAELLDGTRWLPKPLRGPKPAAADKPKLAAKKATTKAAPKRAPRRSDAAPTATAEA